MYSRKSGLYGYNMKSFATWIMLAFLSVAYPQAGYGGQVNRLACDIWPPYQMYQDTELTGYSVQIVKAVYQRMGIPLKHPITALPWSRCLAMLENGTMDALFSANYAPERKQYALYPEEPLISSPWVVWVREGYEIESMQELQSMRVGAVRQYSYTPEFWEFIQTNSRVETVGNDETNFKKLSAGRLDATVAELANGLYLRKKLGIKNIVPIRHLIVKESGLYIIFNKKNVSEEFVNEFSQELSAFKETLEYRNLYEKYIDLVVPETPSPAH